MPGQALAAVSCWLRCYTPQPACWLGTAVYHSSAERPHELNWLSGACTLSSGCWLHSSSPDFDAAMDEHVVAIPRGTAALCRPHCCGIQACSARTREQQPAHRRPRARPQRVEACTARGVRSCCSAFLMACAVPTRCASCTCWLVSWSHAYVLRARDHAAVLAAGPSTTADAGAAACGDGRHQQPVGPPDTAAWQGAHAAAAAGGGCRRRHPAAGAGALGTSTNGLHGMTAAAPRSACRVADATLVPLLHIRR